VTYYRNVFTVEVLSDEPLAPTVDLADLDYLTTEGDCSGRTEHTVTNEQVTEQAMAALLIAQGSDPDFLIHKEDSA
jgi:hypothetical protein